MAFRIQSCSCRTPAGRYLPSSHTAAASLCCSSAARGRPVTHRTCITCNNVRRPRALLRRALSDCCRTALLTVSDVGALEGNAAAMVKDKAEERTLQYQQTLVSVEGGSGWDGAGLHHALGMCVCARRVPRGCFWLS